MARVPSVDNVEAVALVGLLGLVAFAAWKLYDAAGAAAGVFGDAYDRARQAVEDQVDQTNEKLATLNDDSAAAPFLDHFNADHWRPAGYYAGNVLVFGTGGMELRPEYRTENGGPGY